MLQNGTPSKILHTTPPGTFEACRRQTLRRVRHARLQAQRALVSDNINSPGAGENVSHNKERQGRKEGDGKLRNIEMVEIITTNKL